MIELRNRQYMTIFDCTAVEDLEQGMVVALGYNSDKDVPLVASKATAAADVSDVTGPLIAYWINERSTTVAFEGGEDGLSFPLASQSDEDAAHYIPSGSRMLAVGGKGVAEIRFFEDSLDTELDGSLPDPGTELEFDTGSAKLCTSSNGSSSGTSIAYVVENDGVSVSVVLG